MKNKFLWIGLGVFSVLLPKILPDSFIEQWYSRGLFLFIRSLFDSVNQIIPFAVVYILFFVLVVFLGYQIRKTIKSLKNNTFKKVKAIYSVLSFVGGLVFFFQLLWGFNYGRIPLEKQLKLEKTPLQYQDVEEELAVATDLLLSSHAQLQLGNETSTPKALQPQNMEELIRQSLEDVLSSFNYPKTGSVRGRLIEPKGILKRFGSSGIYIPFTGEGHVDAGNHHLRVPFVMAHEMAHGYGFGDEGVCNFIAYLACSNVENTYLNYIADLAYWRYVVREISKHKPELSMQLVSKLPMEIQQDFENMRNQTAKYKDFFPMLRDDIYNTYLKTQGVKDGMASYSQVVILYREWRKKEQLDI